VREIGTLLKESRQGEALISPSPGEGGLGGEATKKLYIESYGCQMNFSDSEIVASIMAESGYGLTTSFLDADLILVNTCAIRDNAEQRVRNRLVELGQAKKLNPGALIGMLGCMAERLKEKLLEEEQIVDIVVGPDAYRHLPNLVEEAGTGQKAVNVFLSREETYANISPVRLQSNGVTAFISIMRGCDNMCSFCVVPFTRGRERSRDPFTIVAEARQLFERGYREVTLLGQNVDSYKWSTSSDMASLHGIRKGEVNVALPLMNPRADAPSPGEKGLGDEAATVNFAALLRMVASIHPALRVRFSTSHPKDITDEVLHTMAEFDNICNYIHLPVQSGSSRVLKRMNRTYDRAWYLERLDAIRRIIPDCGISTDIIAGFCGEADEDHEETLSIMRRVKYDMAYMFAYSERPGTLAARKYEDDVTDELKQRRLNEIIGLQMQHSLERNRENIGKTFKVLVEGPSKRSSEDLCGRTDQNKMVVFPSNGCEPGDYVEVLIEGCTSATLLGKATSRTRNHELQTTNHKPQTTNHKPQTTN
jgi:tRNA-2-methylthio-N6-dimethylallyladenosine synthase